MMPSHFQEFVNESVLQDQLADLLKKATEKGATQAEVGVQVGLGQEVSVRQQAVETIEYHRDKSIALTVYIGQQKGSASTNDMSPQALEAMLEAAINLAKVTEPDPYSGLASLKQMAHDIPDLDLYHPWVLSTEEAIARALETERIALAYDSRIVQSEGSSIDTSQSYSLYGNTHGFLAGYPTARHSASCVVIAKTDLGGMERDYEYTVARRPEDLWTPERIGREAAKNTLERLNHRTLPTQKVPVLFNPSQSIGLLSRFIAGISGGNLFRKASFLCDSLGRSVFPKGFRLYEEPYRKGGLGSSPFDNDGVTTIARDLVTDGVVSSYVLSAYSARRLGLLNTGNAGGVTNLIVDYPMVSLEDLLLQMDTGFWVTELMGQGINLITGDYSRGAAGFWVEKGKIQYPVSGVTIAGNLKDMFAGIIGIGNDIDNRHTCELGSVLIREMMVAGH